MAERRMFHTAVVEADAFLDLPLSTQVLYFHLGMQADDDGERPDRRRGRSQNRVPAKTNGLCGERRNQDALGISCLQEMENCILCFDDVAISQNSLVGADEALALPLGELSRDQRD